MKRKIKLRDMTKEQWERFRKNDCYNNIVECKNCPLKHVNCSYFDEDTEQWIDNKDLYSDKLLDQEVEIEMLDILDKQEKEYLRAVIRPFRNRVISIKKIEIKIENLYSICIKVKSEFTLSEIEHIDLPIFKNDMYMGMEANKSYTLEELDL